MVPHERREPVRRIEKGGGPGRGVVSNGTGGRAKEEVIGLLER